MIKFNPQSNLYGTHANWSYFNSELSDQQQRGKKASIKVVSSWEERIAFHVQQVNWYNACNIKFSFYTIKY